MTGPFSIRLLAMAPPTGSVDPSTVECWLKSGIQPLEIALVLREPHGVVEDLLGPRSRLGPLAQRCRAAGIPVVVGCTPHEWIVTENLLARSGADGIHLRGDPDPRAIRTARRSVTDRLLGRSVHGEPAGPPVPVDYTVFAPVFEPRTPQAGARKHPAGIEALARWSQAVREPVFALGGVAPETADACLAAGAHGLAGIRSFFGDPGRVIEDGARLRAAVLAHPSSHAPVPIRS